MIIIQQTLVSDEVMDNDFVCNLNACKGGCCVEGDEGALLEESEIKMLEKVYPKVKPYLTKDGIKAIEKQGYYITNKEGELKTPLINNGPCAYIYYNEGVALCGIEKAYREKKIKWQKPISCHLYPIRITKVGEYDALNYERWKICRPACKNGKELNVPVFRFVKDALIRKYGKEYYRDMEATYEYRNKSERSEVMI
ncbi:MAG: DUF3109 family protein [Fimbriimonadaceae bacterium]|nr:DUF3109 family protein [Chitinophagales bacterium]